MYITSPVQQVKLAPKSFKCSSCGQVVEQGRVYVKTNYGRYCDSCADGLAPIESPVPA